MNAGDIAAWTRRLQRAPLLGDNAGSAVAFGSGDIERLIPHRWPFLLLDSIESVDLERGYARGSRLVDPADPLLEGHFPGNPIYPGVLQIEIMGQLGLCIASLVSRHTLDPVQVEAPAAIRATRVHQAVFYSGVTPGERLTVCVGLIDRDPLAATAAGQIYCERRLCAISLLEVCFVD